MSDRVIFRRPIPDLLSVTGTEDSAHHLQSPIYEGLVVDVILDHNHSEYSRVDGYNVGAIKVRIFEVNQTLDDALLPWADPIDSTIQELPLIGELVTIFKIRGNFFYNKKVPIAHRLQENGMLKLNDLLNNKSANSISNAVITEDELAIERHKFGKYFKPDSRVRALKHFEGDVIIQGRMGNSIRFGSSKIDPSSKNLAPNILLRAGQGVDLEQSATTSAIFGLILEDINADASSVWIVSDQVVPLEPTTINAGSFCRSLQTPLGLFDKASVVVNSGRVILNSKTDSVLVFSNKEIYLNSFGRASIDSNESVSLTANLDVLIKTSRNWDAIIDNDFIVKTGKDTALLSVERISLASKKIYVGSIQNDAEPFVGGTSLSLFLARLILTLIGGATVPSQATYQLNTPPGAGPTSTLPRTASPGLRTFQHVITPVGPGQLSPIIVSELIKLYQELSSTNAGSQQNLPFSGAIFNSIDSFVTLANEDVSSVVVKNAFPTGARLVVKDNEWVLSEQYYKVL